MKSSHISDVVTQACHHDIAYSAIVNVLARSAPFLDMPESEILAVKEASWDKEIDACTGPDRPRVLNYSVWFSPDPEHVHRPLSDYLTPALQHNRRIRSIFGTWKETMRGKVLFPQIQTTKSVSRETAAYYHQYVLRDAGFRVDKEVSTAMLERLYAQTGYEVPGACEIRQSWGYGDLTPRSYFPQGGVTFHGSKYIRQVFNLLANVFPETNFHSRFSISDMVLNSKLTAFIYDYSSFTSNLTEFKYFIEELASFTDDVPVMLIDSFRGPINWTLGELLREYNRTCNVNGEFTLNRYIEGLFDHFRHNRAGFLGVYGNITGCTVLHGLHACQLCGDSGGCKCVGDDVFGIGAIGETLQKSDLITSIQSLGSIQEEKMKWWPYKDIEAGEDDDEAWPYCKRPLDRLQNRMVLEQALFLPIFGAIVPIVDSIHDPPEDLSKRVKLLAVQTLSLIRQIKSVHPPLRPDQQNLIENYLRALFVAIDCPTNGRLPCESFTVANRKLSRILLPSLESGFLYENHWELLRDRYGEFASHPIEIPRCLRDRHVAYEELFSPPGNRVETCMDQRINYMEKMEWCITRQLEELRFMSFDEFSSYYESLFLGDLIPLYEVYVLPRSPSWLVDLSRVVDHSDCQYD